MPEPTRDGVAASRSQIALGLLFFPVRAAALVLAMVAMVLAMPLVLAVMVFTVVPAEIMWLCSPFVGLVSPRIGHKLASFVDPAADVWATATEVLWAPAGWLGDVVLR